MDNIAKTAILLDPTAKTSVFDYIGFYGPRAVVILNGILLLNQVKFLAVYILLYFINHWVNRTLKDWIKQPRPSGSRPLVGETYGRGSYGMPSYHAQKICFAVAFLYLVKQNMYWLIAGGTVALLTIYQRWKYRAHSLQQLGAGALLGISIAWFGYYVANLYLKHTQDLYKRSDGLV